ncbi:MAG: cytochrome c biogenesis protein CcsA [Mariniphaga sp.]|nr:cytochrome c biogenesis protein CcsA [Mariniphaga sp.]
MKKIYSFITSLSFMAFLFLALIIAMAVATFIESSHGSPAARSLVYNAWWFELLWALFGVNLLNNIFKYRLFTKKRFTIGLFHLAFIVMILGAAITRWFSFEGTMHIRENESAGFILSSEAYFYAGTDNQQKEKVVRLSESTPKQFSTKLVINGEKIKIKTIGFISQAERKPVSSASGEPIIDFVFSAPDRQGMQSFSFRRGDKLEYPGFTAGFEVQKATGISFFARNNELFMTSDSITRESTMGNQETIDYQPGDTIAIKKMFLYNLGDFRFLVRDFLPSATFTAVKSNMQTGEDAVIVKLSGGGQEQIVQVFGRAGNAADTLEIPMQNATLKLAYGAKPTPLPFQLFLNDFQLERYPGSQSPSSYASEVVLIDEAEGVKRNERIYMNNTLTYKGYKFFQSSYDTDEKGTILSVNHDYWGTWISYLSYALMTLGFILSLINKNSYFNKRVKRLKQISAHSALTLILVGGMSSNIMAQPGTGANIPGINSQVVKEFSELWVQGVDGRIEPLSTLNSEIIRKVARKSILYDKSADEVILSMMTYPEIWQTLPFVRVANKSLAQQLGLSGNTISIRQLFDDQGNYKISSQVQAAFNKPAAFRNRVEKELIYLDERVSICFMVFRGSIFHLFPRQHINDPWYSPGAPADEYSGGDSIFISDGFNLLNQSLKKSNNQEALEVIQAIGNFQQKFGADLLPAESKKKTEILYNKVNPFQRIFPFYLLFGFVLLFVLFINIFRLKPLPVFLKNSFLILIIFLFLIHTAGIILRWYIADRAPWSNGYESVVYVAWTAMLAGILFGRKYPMVVGTAALLAGISLFTAHLSWMNPEITPLVPVLKSYWLTIHVSVITASYGFIGLSAFLGILVMILIILRKKSNQKKVNLFIDQLTTINEMSVTVGLYFLTIGTFLGGIWANESWGRYWGWDPKETWSLITIVVYSFISHMRLIPSLKGIFNYNLASVAGFASVIMTYFGVNYYLTGLHSYGQGVADRFNPVILVVFALIAGLIYLAYYKNQNNQPETNKKIL